MATTRYNSFDSDSSPNNTENEENNSQDEQNNTFECNICLDNAKDAVVSVCGHLFCWPCLHQWLEMRSSQKECPVCKGVIDKDEVIPIYGRGNTKQEDPRNKVPTRSAGQDGPDCFSGFTFGDGGFRLSFGLGAFNMLFNFSDRPHEVGGQFQIQGGQYLSNLFLWIGVIFILWILLT